jgi:dTDP-4-amino-4,6-dideoxygalactose transaminase
MDTKMNEYKIVDLFEATIAEYSNSKYAVAVDSCTSALFLSLIYRNIRGKHVIIPSHTYISVPCSIINAGGKPKFINKKWKGIYSLDPFNIIDGALRFTENMFVKDTLHCLSFHIKKHLNIGKGGMVLTDDKDAYKWLKLARYNGRSGNDYMKEKFNLIGWNMYMTPEDASRGIRIFKTMSSFNEDKISKYQDLSPYNFDNVFPGDKLYRNE